MKIKKISFFLFFIIFSSLLSSEITYLSSKTFQDENAIQIVISINSTEEIDKSDISIFEYQTSSSIKDSLFNLSLSRVNISEYNLSFEKLKDTDTPYALFTMRLKITEKTFLFFFQTIHILPFFKMKPRRSLVLKLLRKKKLIAS